MAQRPLFFSNSFTDPKRKYKFFVEFLNGEAGFSIGSFFPNYEYQWFIKSCTKPSFKATVTGQEETINIANIPDPRKRIYEASSWNPITIKFINPFSHTFKPAIDNNQTPKEDKRGPLDLDKFFSNVMRAVDVNQGANVIVPIQQTEGTRTFTTTQAMVAEYRSRLSPAEESKFSKLPQREKEAQAAQGIAGVTFKVDTTSSSLVIGKDGTINYSQICKGNATPAFCKFHKFFGNVRIWDMANGFFTLDEAKKITDLEERIIRGEPDVQAFDPNNNGRLDPTEAIAFINNDQRNAEKTKIFNMADTFPMGYWYLIAPWIDSIDVGSHDYASDELQEYTVTIGYESARYVSVLDRADNGDLVLKELLELRKANESR